MNNFDFCESSYNANIFLEELRRQKANIADIKPEIDTIEIKVNQRLNAAVLRQIPDEFTVAELKIMKEICKDSIDNSRDPDFRSVALQTTYGCIDRMLKQYGNGRKRNGRKRNKSRKSKKRKYKKNNAKSFRSRVV